MDELKEMQDTANRLDMDEAQRAAAKIALVEERLKIDIQKVETATVQVHKKVVSEQVSQQVPVVHEEVQVERINKNQYVEAAPTVRYEGDTTIISVIKEVLVIEKRLMLVEELHISKKHIISSATVTETLLKEEIEISRIETSGENS